jgi:hypothetical protein
MRARLRVAALLIGAGLLAGCSTSSSHPVAHDDDVAPPVRAGDPAYAMTALHDAPEGDYGLLPDTLAEALPNHRVMLQGRTEDHTERFSRALVVGRVRRVDKGNGVVWREDESYRLLRYDDPRADTRTVLVTVSADEMIGEGLPAGSTVVFRVRVPQDADPQKFARGLAGLHRIAVLLNRDPTPIEMTPWRPIFDDRMIFVVGQDGALNLPTMRHGRSFAGDIHTVDDLLAVARGPVTTTTRDAHRFLP